MDSPVPAEPVLFLKPPSALIRAGDNIVLPGVTTEVHHEVELVVLVGRTARGVSVGDAMACVAGYALGLDMTARDIQARAKEKGLPWSVAKGFDTFAPLGDFSDVLSVPDPHELTIALERNGEVVQRGSTADMLFRIPQLIAFASSIFTLEAGDLIYTGTPEGVGPVQPGDVLLATADPLPALQVGVIRG